MKYRELFRTQHEFFRSTRIDLDKVALNKNFVVTPLFAHVLDRVVEGLLADGPRAISVTGPYGTGKSTTILQLLRILESEEHDRLRLQDDFPELRWTANLPRVISIPVIGVPGAIGPNIKAAISRWAESQNDRELLRVVDRTDSSDVNAIINLIDSLRAKYNDRCLVLVIDELGKHLEYASSHPDENDVYLLQLIAEYADRSSMPKMTFITILHQAFENYGHRLLRTQREEFAKIQGRFEDIAFQVPVEDTLKIVASAIASSCSDPVAIEPCRKRAEQIGQELYNMGAISQFMDKYEYLSLCRQCAPFHPMAALLMGPLFRHFAQNERSLFSMLGSNEPHGFQRFLDETEFVAEAPQLYGLPELYEYIATSLGSSIYHSTFGRRWAIIETALGRVPDVSTSARDLVKAIGLISAVPIRQLVASRRALELSTGTSIDDDLLLLTKRSIIVHRRFSNSYRLWDGSDIDVEGLIEEARRSIGVPPLVESLAELVPPRPITARKHSMLSGALRWFDTTYLSPGQLHLIYEDPKPSDADGRIYVVISTINEGIPSALPDLKPWQMVVWTVVPSTLLEAVAELYYVRWVMANTPALLDDEVARREITEREHDLEQLIERTVNGAIQRLEGTVTVFTYKGVAQKLGGKQINGVVSELCDELYPKAPQILNEFVNRNVLSSAATAARNDVLKRMVECPSEQNLGITGYPPQLPIYLSTLRVTGLHRPVENGWEICPPERGSTWFDSWAYVEERTKAGYCSVAELWEALSLPPYGIRRGLLPVLTVAFMCAHRNRVSILENDSFVPELSTAVIERLLRSPEHFKIRLTEISGNRKAFVELMVRNGALAEFDSTTDLLALVRPLVSFAHRLPEYTKTTKLLSQQATMVRQTLLNATEPADLLFCGLPAAVGFEPIDDSKQLPLSEVVARIVTSIRELADCYPRLLRQIQSALFEAFGLHTADADVALNRLRERAMLLQNVINDLDFKAILWRMSQDIQPDKWIESVASVIMKKTPKNWFDRTLDDFRVELVSLERKFVHYETLASLYNNDLRERRPIRIGITTPDVDFETVVNLSDIELEQARSTVNDLLTQCDAGSMSGNQLLFIASELVRAYYLGSQRKGAELRVEGTSYLKPVGR
ncbi:MAG: ATP-binding protein [Alicyclobacillus sp.]|nr:ATP-binding protein [Alicyclobacillus sp.]